MGGKNTHGLPATGLRLHAQARGKEVEPGVSSSHQPIAPIYHGWATPRVLHPLPWDSLGTQGWAASSLSLGHPSNIPRCCQSGVPEMLPGTHAPHMPSPRSGPHWCGEWQQLNGDGEGEVSDAWGGREQRIGQRELLLARWGGSRRWDCEARHQAFGVYSIGSLDTTDRIQILG